MAIIFRRSEEQRTAVTMAMPAPPKAKRPLWQNATFFAAMVGVLVFGEVGLAGEIRAYAPAVEGLQEPTEVDLSAVEVPAGMGVFLRLGN